MKSQMKFDYSKLLGKIKENGYILSDFAKQVGLASSTFSLRLSGVGYFRQPEIVKMCDILGIAKKDIPVYFFTQKVQKN